MTGLWLVRSRELLVRLPDSHEIWFASNRSFQGRRARITRHDSIPTGNRAIKREIYSRPTCCYPIQKEKTRIDHFVLLETNGRDGQRLIPKNDGHRRQKTSRTSSFKFIGRQWPSRLVSFFGRYGDWASKPQRQKRPANEMQTQESIVYRKLRAHATHTWKMNLNTSMHIQEDWGGFLTWRDGDPTLGWVGRKRISSRIKQNQASSLFLVCLFHKQQQQRKPEMNKRITSRRPVQLDNKTSESWLPMIPCFASD